MAKQTVNIPEDPKILETISTFKGRLDHAKMEGEEWLETSPEIIKYYNRQGVGKAGYYVHEGIKVCEYGKKEEIIERENMSLDEILHGKGEAKIIRDDTK